MEKNCSVCALYYEGRCKPVNNGYLEKSHCEKFVYYTKARTINAIKKGPCFVEFTEDLYSYKSGSNRPYGKRHGEGVLIGERIIEKNGSYVSAMRKSVRITKWHSTFPKWATKMLPDQKNKTKNVPAHTTGWICGRKKNCKTCKTCEHFLYGIVEGKNKAGYYCEFDPTELREYSHIEMCYSPKYKRKKKDT